MTTRVDVPRTGRRDLVGLAAVCGALAGIGGATHGIGEVRQGAGRPGGPVFDSWVDGRIAANLGGEPALTVLPDVLVAGLLTILVSLAVVVWSVRFVDGAHGGAVLVALSVTMLVVGGGFGPPLIGMLAGLSAGAAHARVERWARLRGAAGRRLAAGWPALYWTCVLDVALLVIGSFVVGGLLDVAVPGLFVSALFLAVLALPLATAAGLATWVGAATSGPVPWA